MAKDTAAQEKPREEVCLHCGQLRTEHVGSLGLCNVQIPRYAPSPQAGPVDELPPRHYTAADADEWARQKHEFPSDETITQAHLIQRERELLAARQEIATVRAERDEARAYGRAEAKSREYWSDRSGDYEATAKNWKHRADSAGGERDELRAKTACGYSSAGVHALVADKKQADTIMKWHHAHASIQEWRAAVQQERARAEELQRKLAAREALDEDAMKAGRVLIESNQRALERRDAAEAALAAARANALEWHNFDEPPPELHPVLLAWSNRDRPVQVSEGKRVYFGRYQWQDGSLLQDFHHLHAWAHLPAAPAQKEGGA